MARATRVGRRGDAPVPIMAAGLPREEAVGPRGERPAAAAESERQETHGVRREKHEVGEDRGGEREREGMISGVSFFTCFSPIVFLFSFAIIHRCSRLMWCWCVCVFLFSFRFTVLVWFVRVCFLLLCVALLLPWSACIHAVSHKTGI